MVNNKFDDNNYCSTKLSYSFSNGIRLEASVYITDNFLPESSKNLIKTIKFYDKDGFVESAFYPGRFTRNYIPKKSSNAIGFIGSAEMLDIYPKPQKFLSTAFKNIDNYRVSANTLLLSRSGTIGKITLVSEQLENLLVSEHAIRIKCTKYPGYLYAFLKSNFGQSQLLSKIYGAVVDQIEPEHLEDINIPLIPIEAIEKINSLVIESFEKRDQSNQLLKDAEILLLSELNLTTLDSLTDLLNVNNQDDVKIFSTKLSKTKLRFEGSYNIPVIDLIMDKLIKNSSCLKLLSDETISKDIIQPTRFKRVYVDKENGIKFIGGKELNQLDPSTEKYLSKSIFNDKIKNELLIRKKSIIVTSRGSLGKCILTPDYFENWAISDNLIQIIPTSENIAGYLFVFLSTEFGKLLMTRYNYGGVIDVLESSHLANVPIPILKNEAVQFEINNKAIKAIQLRNSSYELEQEAFSILDSYLSQ